MVRRMTRLAALPVVSLWLLACGGSEPPAQAPDAEATPPAEAAPPPEAAPPKKPEPEAEAPKEEPKPEAAPVPEPVFTDGMSVAEAQKAVPQGAERANMDQETLGEPLRDFALYEPCKPGTVHFKIKIAVYDGRVVGSDVTATPKNDKMVACIKDRLKTLSWKAHVKSVNTVEYAF
jgi:hypothetical protein